MSTRPPPVGAKPVGASSAPVHLSRMLFAGLLRHEVADIGAQDKAKPSKKAPAWSFGFPKGPKPLEEANKKLAEELAAARKDNAECESKSATLRKRALEKTQEVSLLQAELEQAKRELAAASDGLKSAREAAVRMLGEKNAEADKVRQIQEEFNAARSALDATSRRLADTEQQLSVIVQEKMQHSEEIVSMNDALTRLRAENDDVVRNRNAAKAQIDIMRTELEKLERLDKDDGGKADEALSAARKAFDNISAENERFFKEAEEVLKATQQVEESVSQAERAWVNVQVNIDIADQLKANNKALEEEIKGLELQIKALIDRLANAKSDGGGNLTTINIDSAMATPMELAKAIWNGDARRVGALLEAGVDLYADWEGKRPNREYNTQRSRSANNALYSGDVVPTPQYGEPMTPASFIFFVFTGEATAYRALEYYSYTVWQLAEGKTRTVKRGKEVIDAIAASRNGEFLPLNENTIRNEMWTNCAQLMSPELVAYAIQKGLLSADQPIAFFKVYPSTKDLYELNTSPLFMPDGYIKKSVFQGRDNSRVIFNGYTVDAPVSVCSMIFNAVWQAYRADHSWKNSTLPPPPEYSSSQDYQPNYRWSTKYRDEWANDMISALVDNGIKGDANLTSLMEASVERWEYRVREGKWYDKGFPGRFIYKWPQPFVFPDKLQELYKRLGVGEPPAKLLSLKADWV